MPRRGSRCAWRCRTLRSLVVLVTTPESGDHLPLRLPCPVQDGGAVLPLVCGHEVVRAAAEFCRCVLAEQDIVIPIGRGGRCQGLHWRGGQIRGNRLLRGGSCRRRSGKVCAEVFVRTLIDRACKERGQLIDLPQEITVLRLRAVLEFRPHTLDLIAQPRDLLVLRGEASLHGDDAHLVFGVEPNASWTTIVERLRGAGCGLLS